VSDKHVRSAVFVGSDTSAFASAIGTLAAEGNDVQHTPSAFKALTICTLAPPDLIVIDASPLGDQMLEVFESLKDVAPQALLFAAFTPAARLRAAAVLTLGADAVISLPADGAEIQALVAKLRPALPQPEMPATMTLEQKFEWLGQFAAGVAHNINNPLTTVMGYLQILTSKGDDQAKEETDKILNTMLKECVRISQVVKDLLLFAGNANVQPSSVDVNEAVEGALAQAERNSKGKSIKVECDFEADLPMVVADMNALTAACTNIAINARQAMKKGGTLTVETRRDGPDRVVMLFTDTGPGIPEDELDRIFEPFYSGRDNGAIGLGLATSYGIVKSFGGHIAASSENGSGATFRVELPVSV
jgi:signal transduction histidine kinase